MKNFYITANVDGRKTPISFGPRSKDGGFSLKIYQRSKGEKLVVLEIDGKVDSKGDLLLFVEPRRGARGIHYLIDDSTTYGEANLEIPSLRIKSKR